MGTNYYLRTAICKCCGRYDEQHICKSFHTFAAQYHEEDDPPWETVVDVATWEAWKRRLRDEVAAGGRIVDEYGTDWPLHTFIEAAEKHGPDPDRRQYRAIVAAGYKADLIEPGSTWVDADGFTFYAGEFS